MLNSKLTTKKIVLAAMLAALTVVGSSLRITLPLSIAGTTSFHLGNTMCALSGILLGPWLGGLAAGLGSAIFDMLDPRFISEAWITFMTKGAYGIAAGLVAWSGKKEWGYRRATVATITGAVVYAVLYLSKKFFYNGMLLNGLAANAALITILEAMPATIFNAAVAIICAPMLAVTIRKALKRNHLSLE